MVTSPRRAPVGGGGGSLSGHVTSGATRDGGRRLAWTARRAGRAARRPQAGAAPAGVRPLEPREGLVVGDPRRGTGPGGDQRRGGGPRAVRGDRHHRRRDRAVRV